MYICCFDFFFLLVCFDILIWFKFWIKKILDSFNWIIIILKKNLKKNWYLNVRWWFIRIVIDYGIDYGNI